MISLFYPDFLQDGDKVALIAPAGKVDPTLVERAAFILREQKLDVVLGNHLYSRMDMFAGSDEERAADFQKALDNHTIKAIFFARGGYGSLRTLMKIDWNNFLKHPKWLIGFSDITVFHAFSTQKNIVSIHGVMSSFFEEESALSESFVRTMQTLRGEMPNYNLAPHPLNRNGDSSGQLTGGNLSILMSLRGTSLDQNFSGKILVIEDISEYDYHIDRMMINLKFGDQLSNLAGLIVGHFTDTKSGEIPFGKSAYEIIREAVESYHYPVCFGFPIGHELPNFPLIMGSYIRLKVADNGITFQPNKK